MNFSPEQFAVLKVSDALAHPDFDPHIREIILAAHERAESLTLGELADVLGISARVLATRLAGELVLNEVRRIAEKHAARKGGLN